MNAHGKLAAGGLAIAAAVAAAFALGTPPGLSDSVEIEGDEADLAAECETASVHGSPEAWESMGITPPARGYGLLESCALDGVAADLPAGFVLVPGPVQKAARGMKTTKARAWGSSAEWACACRPVADSAGACKVDGKAAPLGSYLPAGAWSGSCQRTPCVELYGDTALAVECSPPVAAVVE